MTPRVDWATSDTFTFSLPAREWAPSTRHVGADAIAASGIPEAFVVRTDRMRRLTLRFSEAEWVDEVEPWITWARTSGQAFTFAFDADDPTTEVEVYLESPRITDGDVQPTRDSGYLWSMELDVTLRTEDGSQFPGTWANEEED